MESGDLAWVLASAALVLFMTPGLALFYGGMDRSKNVLNMLMMNFYCALAVPVLWFAGAFSFAQGGDGKLFGNFDHAFLAKLPSVAADNGEALVFVGFLATFAIITPALISGAVAGRMKFAAWAVFIPIWLFAVFAPVFKWVYGGWLDERGSIDFAGGTAIHVNAGVAALAAALVLGKRKGFPNDTSPPHSLPLVAIGTAILWFGWFGFNAGSAGAANGQAVQAWLNTLFAAAAAGLAWTVIERLRDGHFTTLGAFSGIVAGLVAITPAAGFVSGVAPIVIGALGGAASCYAVGLKKKLGYDDALDVVGVHLVAGLVGSLLIGFFANPEFFGGDWMEGLFYGGGAKLLVEQAIANGSALVYSGLVTFGILKALDATMGIRVSEEVETQGLDLPEHAETAYRTAN